MYITRIQATVFLLFVIMPMLMAIAILDHRLCAAEHMMDAAIQGIVQQQD